MNTQSYLVVGASLFTCIVSVSLMLLVFWQAPKRRSNQLLTFMMFLLAGYSVLNVASRFLHEIDIDPRKLFSGTSLIYGWALSILYFFSEEFTNTKRPGLQRFALMYLIAYTVAVGANGLFASMRPSETDEYGYIFTYKPAGYGFFLVGILWLFNIVRLLKKNPDPRTQAIWPAAGVMIFGVSALLIRPLSSGASQPIAFVLTFPYNSLSLGLAALILGRAILQYQLFDPLRELNTELRSTNEKLVEANLLKSQFLATMSHELRTPMGAIIGYTELMRSGAYGELNEKQDDRLDRVLSNARHLLNLINDVLDMSKIEAGQMVLAKSTVDCGKLTEKVIEAVRPDATQKGLTLEIECQAGIHVHADERRLHQILVNLMGNAVKFTEKGGIKLIVRDHPETVDFVVQDTGIGMSKEDMNIIFDAFRQVDSSFSRPYQGTGLGLSITRQFVELHGGNIQVDSEMGKGSTFTIVMPKAKIEVPA